MSPVELFLVKYTCEEKKRKEKTIW